ncbi:HAD family hydrolase [Campylobacter hepaticus]|uniref:phosphoglycolate phosphatase n=2 Tax=Campylobacter hepaticus TaxID=1813019 RepID=A0A424Z0S7_9BACT|nr:HAD hydrolase-like protein [Campylobacter hepaticus]RQD67893.1 HAD family hydrolase [Campylobacter hepaticus]RQD87744.1 HAD family hydrolase [Campylobacter hepaticus]
MIFFDFDGVLIDSLKLWEQACEFSAKKLGFKGIFPQKPYAKLNPVAHKEIGKLLGFDALEFEKIADKYFLDHIHTLNFFDNIKELLKDLSLDFKLSVLSASNENLVQILLEKENILQYFTNLHCTSLIPKAQTLKNFKQKNSIMIGDCISDIEAALEANVYSIGVLWGWQDKNMLKKANILVKDTVELKNAIRNFYEIHSFN